MDLAVVKIGMPTFALLLVCLDSAEPNRHTKRLIFQNEVLSERSDLIRHVKI